MDTTPKLAAPSVATRKRKHKAKSSVALNYNATKWGLDTLPPIKPDAKRPKTAAVKEENFGEPVEKPLDTDRFPILKNEELVSKFLKVPMTNNQKGRIRQAVKDSLQGTSSVLVPEIIHNKIQSILKSSENLTDSELRRIRILYNLLKTAVKQEKQSVETVKSKITKPKKRKTIDKDKLKKIYEKNEGDTAKEKNVDKEKKEKKEHAEKKDSVKGPKRYVVFLGNLPLDVDKDKIMKHFSEMNEHILDIRIPKTDGKKSAIAYLEVSNEPSYEFALSKHHSMLGNKRINVLYTAPKKGKVSKAKAKSKSAKLAALQKSGKLLGSVPLHKKRSQRRLKMKRAQAKLANND